MSNIEANDDVVTLYRPAGPEEIELVRQSGWKRSPPRLPGQPIFYPVSNRRYAAEISAKWNAPESGQGFVTRFRLRKAFLDRYQLQQVGTDHHTEWWIPAEDLDELNANIVGEIEVIEQYGDT